MQSTFHSVCNSLKELCFAFALSSALVVSFDEVKASGWGCEVLLCVSGDWKGTSSCHPPMYKLISAMKLPGFSWPVCPQANSSMAKYEAYDDCPVGWSVTSRSDTSDRKPNADKCQVRLEDFRLPVKYLSNGHRDDPNRYVSVTLEGKETKVMLDIQQATEKRTETYLVADRQRREKPYYIDYDDANGVRQRSWFSLN